MDFKSLNFDLAENIFFFHNLETEPLIFMLDSDIEDNYFYFILLNRFFAEVVDKPNKNSMVLVKSENTTYFHRHIPAFDIKYIEDCFKLKDYPDPTKYIIRNSCPLSYTKDNIFDCWFHKKKTWFDFDLISTQKIDDNQSGIKPRAHENNAHILKSNSLSSINPSSVDLPYSTKKTRSPYTHKEDVEIVKYILKYHYAFEVYGRKMWQIMERTDLGKIRTWQSLKQRYIKHIRNDLISRNVKFSFLTPNDLKLLLQGLKVDAIKDHEQKVMKSKLQEQRNEESLD